MTDRLLHSRPLSPRTSIKNFYFTGSDVGSHGIVGALFGGVVCSSVINGFWGLPKVLLAVRGDKRHEEAHPTDGKTLPLRSPLPGEVHAVLVDRRQLNATFYELTLQLPSHTAFRPGQHMYWQVGPGEWRPYSIVACGGGRAVFVVDTKPRGHGSEFVLHARSGDQLTVRLPSGQLRLDDDHRTQVFIATGSGITPFFSMLRQIADRPAPEGKRVVLLWGITDETGDFSDLYLGDIAMRLRLETIICGSQPKTDKPIFRGRVTAKIPDLRLSYADWVFYVCGNPGMVADVQRLLYQNGAKTVHFEV